MSYHNVGCPPACNYHRMLMAEVKGLACVAVNVALAANTKRQTEATVPWSLSSSSSDPLIIWSACETVTPTGSSLIQPYTIRRHLCLTKSKLAGCCAWQGLNNQLLSITVWYLLNWVRCRVALFLFCPHHLKQQPQLISSTQINCCLRSKRSQFI